MLRDAGVAGLDGCDCVVPVPLHPWRRLWRGFNQARDLATRLDRPIVNALWRVRATPPQMALNASERHSNVRGAFVVSPLLTCGARLYRGRSPFLDGRIVLLVDDVRTTGATLDECAKILLAAGVREVRAMTVAVAEKSR